VDALERFVSAQDGDAAGFSAALAELRAGRKRGHWIWYVFPQLAGLGRSAAAQEYGIDGVGEARAYLQHPLLRARLVESSALVAQQLASGVQLERLMGSSVDALKLVSSLTLFGHVARELARANTPECQELAELAARVLAAARESGYPECPFTLSVLARQAS
jgi:uncharacterized protein (DUF1810 family)